MNSFKFTICCLFFFNFCFSQADEDFNRLMYSMDEYNNRLRLEEAARLEAKIRIDNINRSISGEVNDISESSYNTQSNLSKPNPATMLPDWYNTASSRQQENIIGTNVKPALETRNYNIEDAYTLQEDGTYHAKYETYKEGRDNENPTINEDKNIKKNEIFLYEKSSFTDKIEDIIYLLIGWFLVGILINFIFYNGKPVHLVGKSETAKLLHIVANILLVVFIIDIIAS